MKSHMLLLQVVLDDLGTRCCTSTSRDFNTITARVEHEGLSFLTITLPQFGKDFERCLDQGAVLSSSFPSFAGGKHGCLPKLFRGFTELVFDSMSGVLLDDPSIDAIFAVRQACLMFGKLNLPCSDARVAAAIDKFVECERDVRSNDFKMRGSDLSLFHTLAVTHLGDVMAKVDREIYHGRIIPRHGPGSTADSLVANQKYNQQEWTSRLEHLFPHGEFLCSNWGQVNPEVVDPLEVRFLEPDAERPVRVVTVPKTLKTPRIIAIEPTCMQYVQQGIMEVLVSAIENHPVIKSFIGFSDQKSNQLMAQRGSLDGSLATLDLSEASDRVSNQLVKVLADSFPHFGAGLDATRSRRADVPGYGVMRLSKFASMGSALCFPIEAMVFFITVLVGISKELGHPVTPSELLGLRERVRVYGDDIIVPVESVHTVVTALEDFGFRVNGSKSFWTGRFRESCGKEYYAGSDVSIVRVREGFPTQRQDAREIVSTTSLRNQMYFAGNWVTASWLDDYMVKVIPFPRVGQLSPALGRHSFADLFVQSDKECPHLQRSLVRACYESAIIPLSPLDGYGALLKYFLKRDNASAEPSVERDHLRRAGRPRAVNIKLGWVAAT